MNFIIVIAENILKNFSDFYRRHIRAEDGFSQKRCLAWFHEYTTPDEPDTLGIWPNILSYSILCNKQYWFVSLGPDGMEKFCEDIGVEPENIVMLVLAYKMGATQMGFFSQQEWLKGLTDLECDSTAKMVVKLDFLRSILNDPNSFKSIYRYAYDFAKVRALCDDNDDVICDIFSS